MYTDDSHVYLKLFEENRKEMIWMIMSLLNFFLINFFYYFFLKKRDISRTILTDYAPS